MKSLIGWSLSYRALVVGLAGALIVLGGFQLRNAPVDVLPEYTPPYVEIQTEALGLSAAEVEQFVTVPMEALMLNGVAFVDTVRSESVPGLSSIVLLFEPGTDLYRARQMVQERMAQAHALPNVSKPPQMIQPLSSASRVMIVSLASDELSPTELSVLARWTVRPRLMGVEGVANVAIWGHRERQLQVQVDPARLQRRGVTLDEIVATTGNALWVSPLSYLRASTPGAGGFIDTPNQRLGIRHVLPIRTPEDLAQVAIEGHPNLRIGHVATVVEDHQPMIGDASTSAGPSLLLIVEKLPGEHAPEVTRNVEAALAAMQPGLPGVTVDASVYRASTFIDVAAANIGIVLLIALLLVALVIGAFLLEWRAVVIAVASIVTSLMTAAVVLTVLGSTVNALLVAGLVIAAIVTVDDVIVDVDSALQRLHERSAFDEVPLHEYLGTAIGEARAPSIAATVVVLLVVAPILALGEATGAFLLPFTAAFVVAIAASLAVGLTLTPALAALLLRPTQAARPDPRLRRTVEGWHERLLDRALARPIAAYAALALAAIVAIGLTTQVGTSLAPTFKERDLVVAVKAAPGTSQPAMNRIVGLASQELREIPGVLHVASHVGRAIMSDQVVNMDAGQIWVGLDPLAGYDETVRAVRSVLSRYPGIALDVDTYLSGRASDVAPAPAEPVSIRVYGPELDQLQAQAEAVRAAIADVPGVAAPRVVTTATEPTLEVEVDLAAAAAKGVKPGDVRRAAATLVTGLEVGNLFEEQKVFEVMVVGVPSMRHSLSSIERLRIDTPDGSQVALGDVASVRVVPAPVSIPREGISRYVDIVAGVDGRDVGAVLADVDQALTGITFPLEYHPEVSTAWADREAARFQLIGVIVASALLAFLVLQAAFASWRIALLTLAGLPVALGGGVLAVFLTGGVASLGSLIGFLGILAIATRTELALVDRLRQLEQRGTAPGPSLVLRGSRERAGPMVMTALATLLVCVPVLVLADRPGLELLGPMAIVLVGGLVTSTLFNLFVFPSLYLDLTARPAPAPTEFTVPGGKRRTAGVH
jgi:Cu/Ag efflux pump CusA